MASVNSIADGLEARLATITGLQVSSEWKDQPNPPAAIVLEDSPFDQQTTFGGRFNLTFRVLVLVNLGAGIAKAARTLRPYLDTTGTSSIRAAIDGDTTLSGIAEDIDLSQAQWQQVGFQTLGGDVNAVQYWGAVLRPIVVYVAS